MTDYATVEEDIRRELSTISDPTEAMTRVVAILKERVPDYTWVGIYTCAGDELLLGPFVGKPSPGISVIVCVTTPTL